MKRIRTFLVLAISLISLVGTVFASDISMEQKVAAAYLSEAGVIVGNTSSDMMLEEELTRAQMAVIVCKIVGNPEHIEADSSYYSKRCEFYDVPEWAKAYVGYCTANYYVSGYGNSLYGANDPVTPAAACTVMLKCLENFDMKWTYDTACQTMIDLGLAPAEALEGQKMTRGNMAILVCRTMERMGYDVKSSNQTEDSGSTDGITKNSDGSINILPDCPQYVPKEGDVIRCPDGSNYTITNVVRYDSNVFASGPVGELPEPTCDWSCFPEVKMPDTEVRHFDTSTGDCLFIRNQVETRRMQYTIYNALGNEPSAWRGNQPLATIQLSIPAELEAYTGNFWPWRESELVKLVHSRPASRYYVMAWDYYLNGVFQYTRYCVVSE